MHPFLQVPYCYTTSAIFSECIIFFCKGNIKTCFQFFFYFIAELKKQDETKN